MTRKFVGTALLLALIWPPAGIGEEKAQPESATPTSVGKAKAQPQSVAVEAHGDWALQCPEDTPCLLVQHIFLKGNREKPLLSFILQFSDKPSRLVIAIRIPLGVMLTPGIELGVDGAKASTYPFHHCRPEGCLAIFPGSRKLRKTIERGQQANVGYYLTNGKKYSVPVSLKGITAGLRALEKAAKSERGNNGSR